MKNLLFTYHVVRKRKFIKFRKCTSAQTVVVIFDQIFTGWSLKFGYFSQKSSKIWMRTVEIKRELFFGAQDETGARSISPLKVTLLLWKAPSPRSLTSQIQFYSMIQFWATIKRCLLNRPATVQYSTVHKKMLPYKTLSTTKYSTVQYKVQYCTLYCTLQYSPGQSRQSCTMSAGSTPSPLPRPRYLQVPGTCR